MNIFDLTRKLEALNTDTRVLLEDDYGELHDIDEILIGRDERLPPKVPLNDGRPYVVLKFERE
jgi:hypothetical protein